MDEQVIEALIAEGELLVTEKRNFTRYQFKDGGKNQSWIEWNNDFTVSSNYLWLLDLLIEARKMHTGLSKKTAFERYRRSRNPDGEIERLKEQVKKLNKALEKRDAKWERRMKKEVEIAKSEAYTFMRMNEVSKE